MANSEKEKEKGFDAILFDLFRSIKLTIFLLILLAIVSIIGTVITQNAAAEDYIERYGIRLYEVLDFFNLFDMYHSWWFSTILLLLVANLVACSLQRFPGVWNQFFRKAGPTALEDSLVKTLPYVERISVAGKGKTNLEEAVRSCLGKGFKPVKRVETEKSLTLYSEKGRFSRLGVYIAHLSLVIILLGGLAGSLFGFKGFVNIVEGESVDQMNVRTRDRDRVAQRPLPFTVRCDNFKITYYDPQQRFVKEYTSILTILENGKEILKRDVRVNHPLHYKGITFYQSSYGPHQEATVAIQWKNRNEKTLLKIHEGETLPIPNSNAFIRMGRYLPQILNLGDGLQMFLFRPNQPPQPLWALRDGSKVDQQNPEFVVTFEGITNKQYTGLQVAKDPGVWVVWVGCALLIVGLIVSFFFSHQRVWVRIPRDSGKEIVLAGSASKNRIAFEKVFQGLADGIGGIK